MTAIPMRDDRGTTPPTAGGDESPAMEVAVAKAEAMMASASACPVCGAGFTPVGRQAYCSTVCRKRAFRARRGLAVTPAVPVGASRRERTVYECPDCGQRQAGVQWCSECVRPTRIAGLGGECPHCGEPVTVEELNLTVADRW